MNLDRYQIETLRGVLRDYWKKAGHSTEAPDALCDMALRASPSEAEGEWSLSSEPPFVSGWRWIDYWTVDGLPGCKRFMVGDTWMDATIACWRFRGSMPPYAAAPNPSTRSEGK